MLVTGPAWRTKPAKQQRVTHNLSVGKHMAAPVRAGCLLVLNIGIKSRSHRQTGPARLGIQPLTRSEMRKVCTVSDVSMLTIQMPPAGKQLGC